MVGLCVATRLGAAISIGFASTALYNRLTLRQLRPGDPVGPVTVCIPARNERTRLPALITDLRAQRNVELRILVLDDDSTDGTSAAASIAIDGDPRFEVLANHEPPTPGWTGKAAACRRLADAAGSVDTLVFLDADVRLEPDAIAAAVAELRSSRVALLSPWPLQLAESRAERLVQPLLCWSWSSSLPITIATRTRLSSTVVACGQFLVFDGDAYREIAGHAAVASSVTEDLDIARALRRAGHRTAPVGSGGLVRCRMYTEATELDAGYTRWLWSAYGSAPASAAVVAVAALAFVVPPVAALAGSRAGLVGYLAAVASRLLARSTESDGNVTGTDVLDAFAHPVSVLAYARLTWRSHRALRRGDLSWKGRGLDASGSQTEVG